MKDWHWVIVFASILITPFLPALMKAKCPACKKRKLNNLDTLRSYEENEENEKVYYTFHRCAACQTCFKQRNSAPLEASTFEEYEKLAREAQERQPVVQ
jgi:type II secretory ATPase GspE/PulE/Tfp pilus assembly ATPase PilB-like protein